MSHPSVTPSTTTDFLDQMLASHTAVRCVYVAFSGGMDSTVLLHQTRAWQRARNGAPEVIAWHVNHQMQEASDDWENHCSQICGDWELPFQVSQVQVELTGQGYEAAAREARYGVFEQGMEEGDILLMAHHLDDQVETFFLRLMRGSGLRGLSSMPVQRSLGRGELARPLLYEHRETLQAYAVKHSLTFVEDSSNEDTSLDRNYLRQQVLPLLEQRWPAYRQTVDRAARHVSSALSTLEDHLPEPVTVYSSLGDPGVPLQVLVSNTRDVAIIRLRSWLHAKGLSMPSAAVVDEFLRQLNEGIEDSAPKLDCGSYAMQRYGDAVYLLPDFREERDRASYSLATGESCNVGGVGTLSLVRASKQGVSVVPGECFDIVWRSGGERCRPLGREHSQTLKKLFQERSVPPWWRARVPLLFCGDEMLAVGDLWFCESSRFRQVDSSAQRGGQNGAQDGAQDPVPELWKLLWNRNTFDSVD
ncbi:MAG: tRNA lysidine(34) synthetase TilS [Halioglobus sp.]